MKQSLRKGLALLAALLLAGPQTPLLAQSPEQDGRAIVRVRKGETAAAKGDRWAVIVGVDHYASPDIEPLSGAVADAKAIRDVLVEFADFPESQVFLLVSDGEVKPTPANIMERLEEIKLRAGPDQLLLFFFAGHGVQVDGQRYLLCYDTRINSSAMLKTTSLPATTLVQQLEAIPVRHRLVMVDACRNDPTQGGRPNLADEALETAFTLRGQEDEGGVRATFLSSSRGQTAYEWRDKQRGFFSYFVEQGLKGEAAQFGKVTVTSLLTYLNEMVPQKVREQRNQVQIPYARVSGSELVLASGDRLEKSPGLGSAPLAAPRTIYGVVKDSAGMALEGALVRVALGSGGRAVSPPPPPPATVTTDEDGFFKVEGIPPDVEAAVEVRLDGFTERTLVSEPEEAGKKLRIFLARDIVAPVAIADARASAPAAPAPPVVVPTPKPTPEPTPEPTREPAKPAPVSTVPVTEPVPTPEPAPPEPEPPVPAPVVAPPAPAVAPHVAMAAELAMVAYRTFLVEDFEAAIESAREALELDPSNAVANGVLGNALVATGLNSENHARIDEARRHVATALELDSDLAIAHNARALEQVADKQMDEARRSLRRAIQSDPALGPAHANLAYLLAQAGDLKEAEREYRLAIALDSESAVPYNGLSDVLFQRKKFKDAVQASLEAISRYELRDRVLGLFYVQLAVTQFQRGKHNESAEAVARAKALGVTDHPAFEALARGKGKKG